MIKNIITIKSPFDEAACDEAIQNFRGIPYTLGKVVFANLLSSGLDLNASIGLTFVGIYALEKFAPLRFFRYPEHSLSDGVVNQTIVVAQKLGYLGLSTFIAGGSLWSIAITELFDYSFSLHCLVSISHHEANMLQREQTSRTISSKHKYSNQPT